MRALAAALLLALAVDVASAAPSTPPPDRGRSPRRALAGIDATATWYSGLLSPRELKRRFVYTPQTDAAGEAGVSVSSGEGAAPAARSLLAPISFSGTYYLPGGYQKHTLTFNGTITGAVAAASAAASAAARRRLLAAAAAAAGGVRREMNFSYSGYSLGGDLVKVTGRLLEKGAEDKDKKDPAMEMTPPSTEPAAAAAAATAAGAPVTVIIRLPAAAAGSLPVNPSPAPSKPPSDSGGADAESDEALAAVAAQVAADLQARGESGFTVNVKDPRTGATAVTTVASAPAPAPAMAAAELAAGPAPLPLPPAEAAIAEDDYGELRVASTERRAEAARQADPNGGSARGGGRPSLPLLLLCAGMLLV